MSAPPRSYLAAASIASNNNNNATNSSPTTTAATTTTNNAAPAAAASSTKPKQEPSFLETFIYKKQAHNPGRDDVHLKVLEPEMQKAVSISFSAINSNNAATTNNNKKKAANNKNDDDAALQQTNDEDAPFPVCAKLRAILQQYGFAIVTDLYTPAECKQLEDLWAQDLLSTITPPRSEQEKQAQEKSEVLNFIKKNPTRNWPPELPLGTKFASDHGLPHGRLPWKIRTDTNVKKVFGSIFGVPLSDLCTGVDNMFFSNQLCGEDDDSQRVTNLWPHADQNSHKAEGGNQEVYQGIVYVWGADKDTSATVIWPGSHTTVYDALMRSKDWSKSGHFCPLPKQRHPEFVAGARRIVVPPGAMLLWSSKTVHQGVSQGPRLAVPVSMESKNLRKQSAYAAKLQLIRTGLPSSHWASLALCHSLAKNNQPGVEHPKDKSFRVEARAHLHLFQNGDATKSINPAVLEVC